MDFEQALTTELSSITGLSNKVFPLNVTEGVQAPFVVYESSDGIPQKTLTGFAPYENKNIKIYIVASSYSDMKEYLRSVIAQLESFIQRFIGGTQEIFVHDVDYNNADEEYFSDVFLYQSTIEATITI